MNNGGTDVADAIIPALRDCFHGAGDEESFLDPGPYGLLDVMRKLSASEASKPVAGASIATHALHVAFSLDAYREWISGVRDVVHDWEKSWEKSQVTEKEWRELTAGIEEQYDRLRQAIKTHVPQDALSLSGAASVIAHTAYHLGMIQLKADALAEDAK